MTITLSRRQLMLRGLVVAAFLPAALRLVRPCLFIYESAADIEGRLLALAQERGYRPTIISEDIGLLASRLHAQWSLRQTAIAGVTTSSTFFVLEQVARRSGLRLRSQAGALWMFVPS
jgi:hypothetical protein